MAQAPASAVVHPIRCVVAATPVLQLGLVAALNSNPGIRVTASASTRRELLHDISEVGCDVALVDLRLTCGTDVIGLVKDILLLPAAPRVMVLLPWHSGLLCPILREAGAAATVPAEIEPSELAAAVVRCARGESLPPIAVRSPRPDSTAGSVDLSRLTASETRVFQLIGEGDPPRVIAARLGVSPKTVESHRANIKAKLGIRSATTFNAIARACSLWQDSGIDYVI